MINVSIQADIREVQSFMRNLKGNAIPRAASRAINDALVTVRAEGAREIKKSHPALRIGDIKSNMVVHKSTPSSLSGSVETKGKPLSLKLYGLGASTIIAQTRYTKGGRTHVISQRGVTAQMGTARMPVVYQGRPAFIIPAYNNEVFVRADAKGRRVRRFRGPSLPGLFRAQSTRFKQIALARWAVTFPSRMQFEIELAKR